MIPILRYRLCCSGLLCLLILASCSITPKPAQESQGVVSPSLSEGSVLTEDVPAETGISDSVLVSMGEPAEYESAPRLQEEPIAPENELARLVQALGLTPVTPCPMPDASGQNPSGDEGRPWQGDGNATLYKNWRSWSELTSGRRAKGVTESTVSSLVGDVTRDLERCGYKITDVEGILNDPDPEAVIKCFEDRYREYAQILNASGTGIASERCVQMLSGLYRIRARQQELRPRVAILMELALLEARTRDAQGLDNQLSGLRDELEANSPNDLLDLYDFLLGQTRDAALRRVIYGYKTLLFLDSYTNQDPDYGDRAYLDHIIRQVQKEKLDVPAVIQADALLNQETVWGGRERYERYAGLVNEYLSPGADPSLEPAGWDGLRSRLNDLLCDCPTASAWESTFSVLVNLEFRNQRYPEALALLLAFEENRGAPVEGELVELEAITLLRLAHKRIRNEEDSGVTLALLERAARRSATLSPLVLLLQAQLKENGAPEAAIRSALAAAAGYEQLPEELPAGIRDLYPQHFLGTAYELVAFQLERIPQQDRAALYYRNKASLHKESR